MSRYIDADALLKEWGIELPKKRPVKGKHSKEVLAFMEKYKNHPYYFAILSLYFSESADVVEVVHGEWVECDDGWDGVYYECSACKEAFTLIDGTPTDNLYNFCPNCGADMRGQKDGKKLD